MNDLQIRCAGLSDIDTVLQFWREAAEGTSISDDRDGVARLLTRDPKRCSWRSATVSSRGP